MKEPKPYRESRQFVVGIFLADDQIIWDITPYETGKDPEFTQAKTARFIEIPGFKDHDPENVDFYECLKLALKAVSSALPANAKIRAFCIAMPGPIRGSGKASEHGSLILTTDNHRRGKHWNKIDLDLRFAQAISELKMIGKLTAKHSQMFVTDAAAYCMGDYCIDPSVAHSRPNNSPFGSNLASPVFAHITVDEGVGGAIIVEGDLLKSDFHAEMGHIPVRRHGSELPSFKAECKAHTFLGCLEGYVSLPALRKRWGPTTYPSLRNWSPKNNKLRLVAYYLAQLCVHLVLTVSVTHIRFSGRVTRNEALVAKVGEYTRTLLSIPKVENWFYPGYAAIAESNFIRRRSDSQAGIYGCLVLAARIKSRRNPKWSLPSLVSKQKMTKK